MSLATRIKLYKRIEAIRKRPLIVYMTSRRENARGQMNESVIPEFCDQLNHLPRGCKAVDLMVISSGGDIMVAWKVISMLRERVKEIGVLVPQTAYSAATLLALGADEIVMHPFANLGPIDPQITTSRKGKDGKMETQQFSTEDMEGFLDFARDRVGLGDQDNMLEVFKLISADIGPLGIGFASRSAQLSQQLGVKLLQARNGADKDERQSKNIVDTLNKRFFTHGYALNRKEAKEIGLNVSNPPEKLEKAMWDCWLEVEKDIKVRTPFDPMDIVSSTKGMEPLFQPPPSIVIPGNTPPQMAQQVFAQFLANAVQVITVKEILCATILSLLESPRHQRMFITEGVLAPFRQPTGAITVNITQKVATWKKSIDQAS